MALLTHAFKRPDVSFVGQRGRFPATATAIGSAEQSDKPERNKGNLTDCLYGFIATVERLADAGVVDRNDARRWSDGPRAADLNGSFF
jgi:hypothetical protein